MQSLYLPSTLSSGSLAWQDTPGMADTKPPCMRRGWTPAMAGILPYAGMDICLFELLRERVDEQYDTPPAHMLLGAGMLSR